jgi:hypothetical protein
MLIKCSSYTKILNSKNYKCGSGLNLNDNTARLTSAVTSLPQLLEKKRSVLFIEQKKTMPFVVTSPHLLAIEGKASTCHVQRMNLFNLTWLCLKSSGSVFGSGSALIGFLDPYPIKMK